MKYLIFLLSLFFIQTSIQADNYKINYKANGRIIKFKLDSVIILTDLNSIKQLKNYERECNWIFTKNTEKLNDTIMIYESWPVNNLLLDLIKMNRCQFSSFY